MAETVPPFDVALSVSMPTGPWGGVAVARDLILASYVLTGGALSIHLPLVLEPATIIALATGATAKGVTVVVADPTLTDLVADVVAATPKARSERLRVGTPEHPPSFACGRFVFAPDLDRWPSTLLARVCWAELATSVADGAALVASGATSAHEWLVHALDALVAADGHAEPDLEAEEAA